ncbi:PilZ domain-containing protein [Hyphococcus sp.]|uniref:PilZ domain-containing protein n=1 Tax=Hyphococcus sp. TaxID=2038636 RepID=UPI002084470E|nr:MAG: hypothetical protein DHS20C04_22620 [Marinicaulis sp.]
MVNPPPDNKIEPKAPENDADRRRHQRVDLPLKARFLTETGDERAAVVLNISAGGAILRAKFPPAFGQSVVLYIDQIGRVEAKVVRSSNDSFAVNYRKRRAKHAKIADNLTTALHNRRRGADRRKSPRVTHDAPATVYLEDGRQLQCAILDISLTGASIEINPRPPLGMHLILGRMTAKVVRRHEKGVGVVFTGAAEHMEEVIADAAVEDPFDTTGAGFAQSFGKKGVRAPE